MHIALAPAGVEPSGRSATLLFTSVATAVRKDFCISGDPSEIRTRDKSQVLRHLKDRSYLRGFELYTLIQGQTVNEHH